MPKIKNQKSKIKIVFMGTPDFGAVILEGLIKSKYRPILIITASDKPVGRKQIITPSPVKVVAEKYKVPTLQTERILNLKSAGREADSPKGCILNLKPDLIVVAAYGQIIPKEILKIPKYGCLNIHPSLLPKYRGPSPIQYTILNGDKETGVTIILMDEKIDHGKIVASIEYKALGGATYEGLSKKLAELGAELLIKTIPDWINGKIKPVPQDESKTTYTKILRKEDGKIDWSKPAEYIERQIRAFNPWPGTFTSFKLKTQNSKHKPVASLPVIARQLSKTTTQKSKLLKVLEVEVQPIKTNKQIGEVFLTNDGKLVVQTGQNCLILEKLQPEGKKKMSAKDFLMGHQGFIGTILN